jgi:hypothetical protein
MMLFQTQVYKNPSKPYILEHSLSPTNTVVYPKCSATKVLVSPDGFKIRPYNGKNYTRAEVQELVDHSICVDPSSATNPTQVPDKKK